MKTTTIFSLLIIFCLKIQAQTVIEGSVLDAQGKSGDAIVTVTAKGYSSVLAFAETDNKGDYRLEVNSQSDSLTITAAGMSIGQQVKVVANHSQRLNFRVKEKVLQLKEVEVHAKKIRQYGDTLNYSVGAYQQQGDRTIGDVLKRMPGIEVSDNGSIKFNGKSISKFYVEDMDLLQGRYGLATGNINAQDVGSVQVLENHQPVKALQGRTPTDDVAINLKLKNAAKGTVAVNTMLGGGGQQSGGWGFGMRSLSDGQNPIGRNPLWTAEVVGMYFAKRRQNITLYKGNNIGDDVSQELTSHYSGINDVGLVAFSPLGVVTPSGSGLPQKRTFDNQSHIVSMNHLEKIGKQSELTLNMSYLHASIRQEGISEADRFYSSNQRLLSSESLIFVTHMNNLSTNLRYNRNGENGFIANVLKLDGEWNNDNVQSQLTSDLTGAVPINYGDNRVYQYFHRPSLTVSNTMNLIQNYGKRTLDLHFSVGYAQRPNTLMVDVDSLLPQTSVHYNQELKSRNIAGDFHTNFTFHLRSFSLDYGILANASLHGIKTDLSGFTNLTANGSQNHTSQSVLNDLWYNTYELSLNQQYKFEQVGWRLSFTCPLNLYTQTLDDHITKNKNKYTRLLVTPSFTVNYEWRDWSGNINASYYKNVGDPGSIYSGYIMNNYRTFQRSYVEHLSETSRFATSASVGYRSALTATFFRINGSYGHTRDNQIYGYEYQGATSVVHAIDKRTYTDNYAFGFDGSKGFDWLQSTIRAFGGYNYSKSERLIAQNLYPFHSRTISIGGGGTITPLAWLNIVITSGYAWNVSSIDAINNNSSQTVRTATQRIKLNVFVTKQFTFTTTIEGNYNNLTEKNRHTWFGDMLFKYKLKHIELDLQANNLFNQHQYTRVNYSGLDIYSSTSQLRPLNIVGTIRFKIL